MGACRSSLCEGLLRAVKAPSATSFLLFVATDDRLMSIRSHTCSSPSRCAATSPSHTSPSPSSPHHALWFRYLLVCSADISPPLRCACYCVCFRDSDPLTHLHRAQNNTGLCVSTKRHCIISGDCMGPTACSNCRRSRSWSCFLPCQPHHGNRGRICAGRAYQLDVSPSNTDWVYCTGSVLELVHTLSTSCSWGNAIVQRRKHAGQLSTRRDWTWGNNVSTVVKQRVFQQPVDSARGELHDALEAVTFEFSFLYTPSYS
jgi:hypothetical protein